MFRLKPRSRNRRGHILIVVILLLSIFGLVAITAVYETKHQANWAIVNGEAQSRGENSFPDDGTTAFNKFLGGLIYDEPDSGQGMQSAQRGHSLTRTMYGGAVGGAVAWNGAGLFHETVTVGADTFDRTFLVNHKVYPTGSANWFDPERIGTRPANTAIVGAYVPKSAPYTYPDMKDFYLASICPETGEVLVPSYYRAHGFKNGWAGGTTGLEPGNPNWTNQAGRYLIVRPRPIDHPGFPGIPQNADGSYTGDVQNFPGGVGPGRNDSILMDIGAPVVTVNGKKVKPLVAVLILDLDGRGNLSVHGNQMNAGVHASGEGLGPWEVSLERLLPANNDGRQIVQARGLPQRRAGVATDSKAYYGQYPAGTTLPGYAPIPWTGFNAANPFQLPGAGGARSFTTTPFYTGGYDDQNTAIQNHPSLYSPTEWPMTGGLANRAFPHGDTQLLGGRHAGTPWRYRLMDLGYPNTATPASLRASAALPNPNPPANNTPNSYRLDPNHANRNMLTNHGYSLDRTGLMPTGLGGQFQNPMADIGGIDMNRSLADYRANTATPLLPNNITTTGITVGTTTVRQAEADRQRFGRDIFARLIISSSAPGATVNAGTGDITITAVAASPDYVNLQNLAQLAVNMVDFIDSDDICSPFVWNPITPSDPHNAANFAAGVLAERVVFGVEKPRFVLNEVYSEKTNDPNDPTFNNPGAGMQQQNASRPAHVRFWLEFQNAAPLTAMTTPVGDGSVRLRYTAAELGAAAPFSPYRVDIVRNSKGGGNVTDLLRNPLNVNFPGNVTGSTGAAAPDIVYDFRHSDAMGAPRVIPPANGAAAGGMVLFGAHVGMVRGPEFSPTVGAWVTADPAGGAAPLSYTVPLAQVNNADLDHHVVLLRRLANPYLPHDAALNPFITIDVVNHVKTADRMLRHNGQNSNRPPHLAPGQNGHAPNVPPGQNQPDMRPQSFGKVQPYAAWSAASPTTFPTSMVLEQDPTVVGMGQDGVRHTFGRQNSKAAAAPPSTFVAGPPSTLSNDTLMTPYDWLVHLDRPLINQIELMHVTAGKPHQLTTEFIKPNGAGGVDKHTGSAQTLILSTQIYRALDLLTVQPRGQLTALGGRVSGRINLNTIQSKRVWDALFDTQPGMNGFTQAQIDAMWAALMASRTPNMVAKTDAAGNPLLDNGGLPYSVPVAGASVHDNLAGGGGDRPFLPFGVPTIPAGGVTTYSNGVGLDDTVLRRNPGTGLPHIAVLTGMHPYQQAEAVRKILNNTTTVSHAFAVWATVVYHEVTSETAITGAGTHVSLGKEYFREIPGDTRFKFFAIVDRSMVAIDPATGNTHAPLRPYFTTVETAAAVGTNQLTIATGPGGTLVYSDGQAVAIQTTAPNNVLVIGTGANRETVTVTAVTPSATPGLSTLTLGANLTKDHDSGECVSNVLPGNPGPQSTFNVNNPMYQAVVPHWTIVK